MRLFCACAADGEDVGEPVVVVISTSHDAKPTNAQVKNKNLRIFKIATPLNNTQKTTLALNTVLATPSARTREACIAPCSAYSDGMFTIEHEFDATVVTLVDDGKAPLQEDVTVHATESAILLNQYDPRSDQTVSVRLSPEQWRDLVAALDLPEGIYEVR